MRATTMKTAAERRAENRLIRSALKVLEERLAYDRQVLSAPSVVRDFLRLRLAELEHEVILAIWLDTQNRLIEVEEITRGTLYQSHVYPREVVKRALMLNAAGLILAHNHPSGVGTPSDADKYMTKALREALALIDVRVLDHFIVGGTRPPTSFVELGLL